MDETLQSRAEELASEFASSATTIGELNALMRLMMKSGLERMLDTEMDVHLGRRGDSPREGDSTAKGGPPNRRNGRSKKTVQGELGEIPIETPRDRHGTFEPRIIEKHQRRIPDFDEKILALYAKGMTTRDIREIVQELYGVEVSAQLVSEVTADLDADVTAWRNRSLEAVWPIVYFDGLVVHVRGENRRVSQHTVYVALGVNLEGKKELLGLWLAQNEGAKFWLAC
jgi:transposase-like protein